MKLANKIFGIIFLLLLVPALASASVLDNILRPFSGDAVGALYLEYYAFIDAVVYMLLFMSLTQMIYGKIYKSTDGKPMRESKLIAVAVGLAMTFGMMVLEVNSGFNLGSLAPLAAIIFFLVFGILLYFFLEGVFAAAGNARAKALAFCITYLIMYGLLISAFSETFSWIEQNVPLLSAILSLCLIIAFVVLLIEIFSLFKSNDKQPQTLGPNPPPTTLPPGQNTPNNPQQPGQPSTITITSPTNNSTVNGGTPIRVTFNVAGPGFNQNYDYAIILNGNTVRGRVENVAGNQVSPFNIIAGTEAPVGTNHMQVVAMRRGFFSHNDIIARSDTITFNVTDNPSRLMNTHVEDLNRLGQALDQYYWGVGNSLVQAWARVLASRYALYPNHAPATVINNLANANLYLANTIGEINMRVQQIIADPDYPRLNHAQRIAIIESIHRIARIIRGIQTFNLQCIQNYNRGDATIPPAGPNLP